MISLEPFGLRFDCDESETILAAALRAGIALRYGCKHGACASCKARISTGEVDLRSASDFALMDYERDEGWALLCSAYPLEDVVIQLDDGYQESELFSALPIRDYRARVRRLAPLTHDLWYLEIALVEPATLVYHAGQYLEINVPGTASWRAFSLANAPRGDGRASFMIKRLEQGLFSTYMTARITPGDELRVRGPFGHFVLTDGTAPIVMVAGGSGMAPIAAMLEALAAVASTREIVFYYGARSRRDLFWLSEIATSGEQLSAFHFVPALSAPQVDDAWQGEVGLITEVLEKNSGNLRQTEAYVCGPPPMIDAALGVLKAKGMFSTRIRYDKFVSTAD